MKKLIFTNLLICAAILTGFAQVGIGTSTPNASSVLDLTSTSKALLLPRLTSTQRDAIASPTAGMVIFNTTTDCMEIYKTGGWYNVCTGTTTGTLPPIDGYTSSNQVAATNLIGYWPFDGSTSEKIHSAAPVLSGGTTAFVAGKLGQGIKLTNGWLTYPANASGVGVATNPFNSSDTLGAGFTLSMWVQVPDTSLLTNLFQLSKADVQNWPLLGLAYRKHADNSVDFDGGLTNVDQTGTHPTYADAFSGSFNDSLSWAFVTMVYDTAGKKLIYYGNGVKKATVNLNSIASTPFPAANAPNSLEIITPNYATIGTFESTTTTPNGAGTIPSYMSAGITGVIDDIRLFNATLSPQQVSDLFQLGNQGR